MSTTPRTDAAYFKQGATMYDLAGESKKLERELAAMTARAEKAEAELAAMTTCAKKLNEECELWEIRCGSIICSGVLDSYTGADLQKWEDEFKKKQGDLIARAKKAEAQLHALTLICGTSDANKFQSWVDREREKVRVLRDALDYVDRQVHDAWPINANTYSETHRMWCIDKARAALDATKESSK